MNPQSFGVPEDAPTNTATLARAPLLLLILEPVWTTSDTYFVNDFREPELWKHKTVELKELGYLDNY